MMDLVGERNMLSEYVELAVFEADAETDHPRKKFWEGLRNELMVDYEVVDKESVTSWDTATELGKLEHVNLDDDGRMTKLEETLARGTNIFQTFGEEARRKYGNLAPGDFDERPLAAFEWRWLDTHGKTMNFEQLLRKHEELLDYFSEPKIGRKYGYLLQCYGMGGQEPVPEQLARSVGTILEGRAASCRGGESSPDAAALGAGANAADSKS